jgi:hypothetical protein
MGWMCSWVAVKGAAKAEILEALDLEETERTVEPGGGEAAFCIGERPGGWTVVFSDDFDWGDRERVVGLSRFGQAVGCQFEDEVEMMSVACAAEAGVELWRVFHVNDPIDRLDVSGEPPAVLAEIRARLLREQQADEDTDHMHDAPIELAKAACGYRADEDEGEFVALTRRRSASGGEAPRTGLLGKLFGAFSRR